MGADRRLTADGPVEDLVRPLLHELERLTGLTTTYLTRVVGEGVETPALTHRAC